MRHVSSCLLLGLAVSLAHAAHAQQPFERFGIKVKVATLSNGRYPEFFHNDSLRRVGSVVYNTRLHRIAYLLPADSLVGRAKPEVTSRWMSPDPLAEEDSHLSPYVFCADNAVRYTDPDGRRVIYGAGATPEFRREFAASVRYMNAHGAAGNLARLQASKQTYYIVAGKAGEGAAFDADKKTITWSPRTGAYTFDKKGGKVHEASPTQLLGHEVAHAERDARDPKGMEKDHQTPAGPYQNKEEERVVKGPEQEMAHKLGELPAGEITRDGHGTDSATLYITTGPTSTKEANPTYVTPTREQMQEVKKNKQ